MAKYNNNNNNDVEIFNYEEFADCSSPICSDISADSKLVAAAAALAIKKLSKNIAALVHHQINDDDDDDEAESVYKPVTETDKSAENKVVMKLNDKVDQQQPLAVMVIDDDDDNANQNQNQKGLLIEDNPSGGDQIQNMGVVVMNIDQPPIDIEQGRHSVSKICSGGFYVLGLP